MESPGGVGMVLRASYKEEKQGHGKAKITQETL